MPPVARQPQQQRSAAPPVVGIPFTGASHEHKELITQQALIPGAAGVQIGPIDIPAFGYLASVVLEVAGAGGVIGTGVLSGDYPWNLFSSIQIQDVNGAPIYGPVDGYAALQSNVWGSYANRSDPRQAPEYVGTLNAVFCLRIPIQVTRHNAFGSLANMNAASTYKLILNTNPFATLLSSVGTATPPTFTIKAWLEAWTLPTNTDMAGRPQAIAPPQHGTTQYWSYMIRSVVSGAQTYQLTRMGNLIRNWIFISRDASGVRADTVFPDPFTLQWDARTLLTSSQRFWAHLVTDKLMQGAVRDVGVWPVPYNDIIKGSVGDEEPHLWIPTVQSTRFELQGNNAAAGTIQTVTNDIAIAEVLPEQRFVENSATGFHPQVGAAVPGAM